MNTYTAEYAEADSVITIQHDGEDSDLIIADGRTYFAVIAHEDMGEEWRPELLDAALTDAGWVRVSEWDTLARTAEITRVDAD